MKLQYGLSYFKNNTYNAQYVSLSITEILVIDYIEAVMYLFHIAKKVSILSSVISSRQQNFSFHSFCRRVTNYYFLSTPPPQKKYCKICFSIVIHCKFSTVYFETHNIVGINCSKITGNNFQTFNRTVMFPWNTLTLSVRKT